MKTRNKVKKGTNGWWDKEASKILRALVMRTIEWTKRPNDVALDIELANTQITELIFERQAKVAMKQYKIIERLRVQLAGCGVAALGYTQGKNKVKKSSYGWSASLQDCHDLYAKYRVLYKEKQKQKAKRK